MKRFDSIDVMRSLAIVFMVYCHCAIFLSPASGPYPGLYFIGNHLIGDFAASMFLFLVGVSHNISSSRARASGAFGRGFKRGLFIFCVGILFSLLMRGPAGLFEWDVLTTIGLSLVALNFLQQASNSWYGGLALVIFVAAPFLRQWTGFFDAWGGNPGAVDMFIPGTQGMLFDPAADYTPGKTIFEIAQGLIAKGFFPIFPWLIFPLLGSLTARHSLKAPPQRHSLKLVLSGLASALAGFVLAWSGRGASPLEMTASFKAPFSFYPNTPAMVLLQVGVCLGFFGACRAIFDSSERSGYPIRFARDLSRYSLTVYFLHHALIYWPTYVAGLIHGNREQYLENAMSTPWAFVAATLFFMGIAWLLPRWNKAQAKYSLEWFLARAVK